MKPQMVRRTAAAAVEEEEEDVVREFHASERSLPWDAYSAFYREIQDDDVERFERRVAERSKTCIINGVLEMNDPMAGFCKEYGDWSCQPKRPFVLAALFGSLRVLDAMLRLGVDVFCTERRRRDNVLHCVVTLAALHPDRERHMCHVFLHLNERLGRDSMMRLLMWENDAEVRPLELAAQLGTFALFRCMFETKGVYLMKVQNNGMFQHKLFDITEYESVSENSRFMRSPLHFLAHMDRGALHNPNTKALVEWEAIRDWGKAKLGQNLPLIVLWFSFRLLFAVLFHVFSMSHVTEAYMEMTYTVNMTEKDVMMREPCKVYIPMSLRGHRSVAYALLAMSTGVVLLDAYELLWWRTNGTLRRALTSGVAGRKRMVVRFTWYRVTQFLTVAFIAGGVALLTFLEQVTLVNQLCALITSGLMMWGIFYFIQLLPHIGHYVTIIQSLLGDILHFQLLFWIMFLPFPFTFYMVLHSGLDCSKSDEFGDVLRMLHDSFLILINLFDISFYMNRVDSPWLLAAIHILFVLISAIMMLNFLIALLANSVTKIVNHSKVIMPLQSLAVVFALESRCYKILRRYYLNKLKCHKNFVVAENKIYLQIVESIPPPNNCPEGRSALSRLDDMSCGTSTTSAGSGFDNENLKASPSPEHLYYVKQK